MSTPAPSGMNQQLEVMGALDKGQLSPPAPLLCCQAPSPLARQPPFIVSRSCSCGWSAPRSLGQEVYRGEATCPAVLLTSVLCAPPLLHSSRYFCSSFCAPILYPLLLLYSRSCFITEGTQDNLFLLFSIVLAFLAPPFLQSQRYFSLLLFIFHLPARLLHLPSD